MANIGNLPGERLAGLSADLFHKVQKGVITLDELANFNQRKNPYFERNKHGHTVVTFFGFDFTGIHEIERLQENDWRVTDSAIECLKTRMASDGYDDNHRLVTGEKYQIALIPDNEIENPSERTTTNFDQLRKKYGYGKPLAGHIPRLRETLHNEQLEALNIWNIACLHERIMDTAGLEHVFLMTRSGICTRYDEPSHEWKDGSTFFAFPTK